jgi:hypothetical protein
MIIYVELWDYFLDFMLMHELYLDLFWFIWINMKFNRGGEINKICGDVLTLFGFELMNNNLFWIDILVKIVLIKTFYLCLAKYIFH